MDIIGERVAHLEDQGMSRDEEIKQLQQEVLRLPDQQIDLQALAEDLENREWRNNIHITGIPTGVEGTNITSYAQDLFWATLYTPPPTEIQLERGHWVCLPQHESAPPWTSWCASTTISLRSASSGPPGTATQCFSRIINQCYTGTWSLPLQKSREFRPITVNLQDRGNSYAWGHSYCLVFRLDGRLHQLSFREACQLLGIDEPSDPKSQVEQENKKSCRWRRHGGSETSPVAHHPDLETIAQE
ncbi:hypothetical protein NDU88_001992 [Pleurodeles waltl]|uniref:Uncharacterized protein n=1 Tax=Pleurodeles waltl TaxID=8319 RepID=A0AAV7MQB7_PLEWA|nr:hypothetical protein NDU88_001992 [Pleurodeles waltl]